MGPLKRVLARLKENGDDYVVSVWVHVLVRKIEDNWLPDQVLSLTEDPTYTARDFEEDVKAELEKRGLRHDMTVMELLEILETLNLRSEEQ